MIEFLKFTAGAIVVLVAGALVLVYLFQDGLLFFPQPLSGSEQQAKLPGVEAVTITSADGTTLRGWLVLPKAAPPYSLLIYFGGNAEEVSDMMGFADRFPDCALLAVNYRGYGASDGKPSERALTADALSIYDYAAARKDIDPKRIYVLGRSLGTGIAVSLAAQRAVAKVVLVTPYDSMVTVARYHYPYLPVSLLLKHRFDSLSRAPAIHTPLFMLTAGKDMVIPASSSEALYTAWGGAKSRLDIAAADHHSIDAYPVYWAAIADFLRDQTAYASVSARDAQT